MDITEVDAVARSVAEFGDRYLRRVYTDDELAYCLAEPGPSVAAHLAARFAAKEAVIKVLRPTESRPDWRSIEVQRFPGGWCELELSGLAAVLAHDAGIDAMTLSMSHDGGYASAVVVARLNVIPGALSSKDEHGR